MRAPEAAEHLTERSQSLAAAVGDRHVEREPAQPRFRRGIGTPLRPRLERLDEGILRALLGRRSVAQDADEHAKDTSVAVAVEAVEILERARLVSRDVWRSENL